MVGVIEGDEEEEGFAEIVGSSDGGFEDVGNGEGELLIGNSSSGSKPKLEVGDTDGISWLADGGNSSPDEG